MPSVITERKLYLERELYLTFIVCQMFPLPATMLWCHRYTIDTIDYVQGIGNGPINHLHPCPKPNTFST